MYPHPAPRPAPYVTKAMLARVVPPPLAISPAAAACFPRTSAATRELWAHVLARRFP